MGRSTLVNNASSPGIPLLLLFLLLILLLVLLLLSLTVIYFHIQYLLCFENTIRQNIEYAYIHYIAKQ